MNATLSPRKALIGITSRSGISSRRASSRTCSSVSTNRSQSQSDQVHLVDAHDHVRDPEQRGDVGVATGLRDDAGPGVDQHHGDVCRRGAGEHVARVALVAGGVGEDERALLGGEEPVGDVDRDSLLALGAQAVGDRGQVGLAVAGDVVEVVGEQRPGVEQQASDQRALAIVHRARGGQPQQVAFVRDVSAGAQKYPSRLRSSIAAAEVRSSARVSPRSETVAASVSAITAVMSPACERTAPVTVKSPTVR